MLDLKEAGDGRAAYNADVLGRLVEFIGSHETGASGVDDLRQILEFTKASAVTQRIKLDPTLSRGLAYYTGAIIEIKVDRRIVVEGVERLHAASHTLLSDRNEAVSLAIAAYLTKGNVYLRGAQQDTLLTFLNTLSKMQLRFEIDDEGIYFLGDGCKPPAIVLETDVHPGFMTDWQQPFTVLLTQAEGMSVVHETIYEDRFGYVAALQEMGAHIALYTKCLGEVQCRFREKHFVHSCVVQGPTPLSGTCLNIPDIRAGCSYILSALCTSGVSEVYGIEHIERGYEGLDAKLRSLGARIERVRERVLKS